MNTFALLTAKAWRKMVLRLYNLLEKYEAFGDFYIVVTVFSFL